MATDYNEIGQNPRINYRKIFTPYSDKTHFIYELIQNADDNKSRCIELQLYENELIVWNDGDEFLEEDVRSICSIGFSNKDLTQIGTFGMGFKAVYTYTDSPEVYSGDERFRLSINNPTKPEGIDGDIDERILKQLKESKRLERKRTIFRLPFREKLRQDEEIALLKDRLCNLEERSLLFLRNLRRVQWYDGNNGQKGSYSCQRRLHEEIQNATEVELRASMNGPDQPSETFLVFRKEVQPPQKVIDELLQQSEDDDERYRIQRSAKKLQPVEVAFNFQDGKITAVSDSVLFSYFPTEKETHLRFFIQASYKTTLARDNIKKDNQWNDWLIQETANFLPDILEQLKDGGLLETTFFNVFPLEGEVENEFKPIAKALKNAMKQRALIPTEKEGHYAKAENVFYPDSSPLRKLVKSSGMHSDSNLLHPDIRKDAKESERCFEIMAKAGVKEIKASDLLCWLEKQSLAWFKKRTHKWLRSLYIYFNRKWNKSELERIKKLPLVRLENGQHVCGGEAFFPPDTDEAREEIAPFLDELPILQSALLEEEEGHDIKDFLEKLGVRGLDPQEMVGEWILPQYSGSDKPSQEQNRLHVCYIFKVWNKLDKYEHRQLKAELFGTPILRAYNNGQPEIFSFVKPDDAYLPEAYTGDTHLETYFSVFTGDIWFVDSGYLDANSNSKEWLQFLKAIGAMDTPRVDKIKVVGSSEECKKRGITPQKSTRPFEDGDFKEVRKKPYQYFDGHIVDPCWVGWSQVLGQIKKRNGVNLSGSVWNLLIKAIKAIKPPSMGITIESARDEFFQGTYYWYYNKQQHESFEANFYRQLKRTTWLPDEHGKLRQLSKMFAPTDEDRKVLGDNMPYLHPDFDISTQPAQWLAKKLGIALKPKIENVMNNLQIWSGTETSVEKVESLYGFLHQQNYLTFTTDGGWTEEFKRTPLIFTPNPESRWWRVDEVFWEDKSGVLGSDHRCLKAHYPATLRSFFINLGVSEQASQRDYACRIQEIATTEQAEDEEVRERLRRLYKFLTTSEWQKDEWKKIIYDDKCWLGKRGKEWGFFTRQALVLKDHPHIGEIFEGEVPFWTFDDLLELTIYLEIEGCSQAKVEFHSEGYQEEDPDWSEKLRNLCPYICAFLKSPRLSEEPETEKFAEVLDQVLVCRVKELKVTYKLKGTPAPDPDPRLSFLEVSDQEAKLWLGLEVNESEYADLIGDALQDYFGIKELGRFVEDLLTPTKKRDRVLSNWKRKGLDTKFLNEYPKSDKKKKTNSLDEKLSDVPNSEDVDPAVDESDMGIPRDNEMPKTAGEDNGSVTADESETHFSRSGDDGSSTDESGIETSIDSETAEIDKSDNGSTSDESENDTNLVSGVIDISSPDPHSSTKTSSGTTHSVSGESEVEMPTVHGDPETGNENDDSTENESEIPTYKPHPGGSRTHLHEGKAINTPNGDQSTGHSSRHSSGKEDDIHMEATDTSPHARKEIERIGMEHARHYEEERGCIVEDVSAEKCGYDLRSTAQGNKIRCIEVKARADYAPVVLTSNEWATAEKLKDDYFLYVVLNAATQPELYIIQNPAEVISEQVDVRYQVPLSEITEHGILV